MIAGGIALVAAPGADGPVEGVAAAIRVAPWVSRGVQVGEAWVAGPKLATARECFGLAAVDATLYAVGGDRNGAPKAGVVPMPGNFGSFERYRVAVRDDARCILDRLQGGDSGGFEHVPFVDGV